MLWLILTLLFVGLIAGFIARAVVPGPDPMGIAGTILLGVVGSFIGGFLGYLLFGRTPTRGRSSDLVPGSNPARTPVGSQPAGWASDTSL